LAARYAKDFAFLAKASLRQAWSQRRREILADASLPVARQSLHTDFAPAPFISISWTGDLQKSSLDGAPVPTAIDAPVLLDASRVSFADSSGLGQLAQLIRRCRNAAQPLYLINPSKVFSGAIVDSQMDSLVTIVKSEAHAMELQAARTQPASTGKKTSGGEVWVSFNCALDASYHDEMMATLDAAIAGNPGLQSLVVDLKEVSFIDSRAVGGLIRTWKTLSAQGASMAIARATPQVREILELLRLDKILGEWKGATPE
jgi:anti-anti-sigma factor